MLISHETTNAIKSFNCYYLTRKPNAGGLWLNFEISRELFFLLLLARDRYILWNLFKFLIKEQSNCFFFKLYYYRTSQNQAGVLVMVQHFFVLPSEPFHLYCLQ